MSGAHRAAPWFAARLPAGTPRRAAVLVAALAASAGGAGQASPAATLLAIAPPAASRAVASSLAGQAVAPALEGRALGPPPARRALAPPPARRALAPPLARRALAPPLGRQAAALPVAGPEVTDSRPEPSAAGAITIGEYRRRLVVIADGLDALDRPTRGGAPAGGRAAGGTAGDLEAIRLQARRLSGERVAFAGTTISPDLSLLRPLAAASTRAAARRLRLRLGRLIAALPAGPAAGADGAAHTGPDAAGQAGPDAAAGTGPGAGLALLARLRQEQALAAIPAGGALPNPNVDSGGLIAAVSDFVRPAAQTVAAAWRRFVSWLSRLIRRLLNGEGGRTSAFRLRSVVILAVLLALAMLGLMIQAWRRRRLAVAAVPAVTPPAAARDEDPLSRAAGRWESYAQELTAAGRFREAIRAWYHAVLVTLYEAGILHFRKGRTNWEYIAAISPGMPWRADLIEITRHFEREWYGRERSSAAALATSQEMAHRLLHALRSVPG